MIRDVVGQLAVAAAAVAGVMAMSGCAPPPQAQLQPQPLQPAQGVAVAPQVGVPQAGGQPVVMRSAMQSQPEPTVFEQTPLTPRPQVQGRQTSDPAASPRELRMSRRQEVDATLNEMMNVPAVPPVHGSAALRAADKAVAPLADTLAAIEAAQRAVVENLRNLETTGFKATRTACGDGRYVASQVDMAAGTAENTSRPLDIALQGDGFLQVQGYTVERPNGAPAFTRNGRLYVSKEGYLIVGSQTDGYKLIPQISFPADAASVSIESDGTIKVQTIGAEKAAPRTIGRIALSRFNDPTALQPLGGSLYAETDESGKAVETPAGTKGAATVLQGYLEASNVDLPRERLRLRFLQTWRASILAAIDGDAQADPAKKPAPASPAQPSVGR